MVKTVEREVRDCFEKSKSAMVVKVKEKIQWGGATSSTYCSTILFNGVD